jgi:DNA-binding FadR family transcriptional regulator
MPKSASERMAGLRARQRRAGLKTVTVVVPQDDAVPLAEWAGRRRREWTRAGGPRRRSAALPGNLGAASPRSALRSEDIRRLRELVEVAAVGLVIGRMNQHMERRLRALVEQGAALDGDASPLQLQHFHTALGDMSGDQTLQFLLRIALHATAERSSFPSRSRKEREAGVARIKRSHVQIVDAMIERNQPLAERRMRRYLTGLKDWLE